MNRPITCENFMERLEEMASHAMPGEELVRLEKHADGCPDCAMLLRLHVHLVDESLADVETRVPDALVAGMWPRLQAEMSGRTGLAFSPANVRRWQHRLRSLLGTRSRSPSGWLVPALAASVMILLIGGGYLLGEVNQLKQRERLLVTSLLQQEQMTASRVGTWLAWRSPAPDPQLLSGKNRGPAWLGPSRMRSSAGTGLTRTLVGEQELSVAQLANLLALLPPRTEVLGADALRTARWQRLRQREIQRVAAAANIPIEDGLQAAEALQILETLDLNPEQTFSTTRLLVLATGRSPGEFSQASRRVRLLGED